MGGPALAAVAVVGSVVKGIGQINEGVFEGVVSAGSVYGTKGFTSDRRLKEDIVKVGVDTRTNLNLYEFSYLGNASRYVGVMADEVEVFYPNAVFYGKHFYKAVNYEMLGIDFRKVA